MCVDEEAAKQLQLPVIDVVGMSSASHPSHQANVYPIRVGIAGLPMAINARHSEYLERGPGCRPRSRSVRHFEPKTARFQNVVHPLPQHLPPCYMCQSLALL